MVRVGNERINLSLDLKGFIDKTECIIEDLQMEASTFDLFFWLYQKTMFG